jgi:hypothetical protein
LHSPANWSHDPLQQSPSTWHTSSVATQPQLPLLLQRFEQQSDAIPQLAPSGLHELAPPHVPDAEHEPSQQSESCRQPLPSAMQPQVPPLLQLPEQQSDGPPQKLPSGLQAATHTLAELQTSDPQQSVSIWQG